MQTIHWNPPEPPYPDPSPHAASRTLVRARSRYIMTRMCSNRERLSCALLNAAIEAEPLVLLGLHRLSASLAASRSSGVKMAFYRIANDPWQLFVLQTTVEIHPSLPRSLCGFLSLVLAQRPLWSHRLAHEQPELVRDLVAKLLHSSPFGAEELGLLSALHGLAILSPPLVAESLRLLAYRIREPSASRWSASTTTAGCELATGEDDELVTIGGVLAPGVLLRSTEPHVAHEPPRAARAEEELETLRRAERVLQQVSGTVEA